MLIPLASETCDACSAARAYVRTIIIPDRALSLTWCKHWFERFELALIAGKYPVLDHRYELRALVKERR
jgi:hypothetical protein